MPYIHSLLAENPERIRNWITNNIHMVWDAVYKLQTSKIAHSTCLRISFYKDSFPIVMQWHKISASELNIGKEDERDTFVSEDLWYVGADFSSISSFADWVKRVQYPENNFLEELDKEIEIATKGGKIVDEMDLSNYVDMV